jgi:flagellar hook-associated protein 2
MTSTTSTNPLGINFNNITVSSTGQVSAAGLSSGIDWNSVVNSIIQARSIPVDQLNTKVTNNNSQIAAYQQFQTLLSSLTSSLSVLQGAVSFDNSKDAFAAKTVFSSVSRTDGQTPTAASNLVGVTVTNTAAVANHSIEILQTAAAEKDSSDAIASTSSPLGLTDGDQFTINGTAIAVSSTDTLVSLRDRINSADKGATPTGVTASIVSVSPTQNFLILTADATGAPITLSNTTGTPLDTIGITSGGLVKHQLVKSQSAMLYADGLLDQTNKTYESARQSSSATTLGSNGTIHFNNGTTTLDLAYTSGQSIQTLASNINADTTLQGMGISASVVTEGNQVRLKIDTTGAAFTMTETGGGSALTSLGMNNSRLLVTRTTNSISDLFSGVSLNLLQGEAGTSVEVDVTPDLSSIKTAVTSFVTAYNAAKVFINQQNQIDATTGQPAKTAVLSQSQTLKSLSDQLNGVFGSNISTSSQTIRTLADIGITFVDGLTVADPTQANTLQIDQTTLNNALNSNVGDVRNLFAFTFTSSDPRVSMSAFTAQTSPQTGGYTLNVGPIVTVQQSSVPVTSSTATLNDGTNSVGATTSGSFVLNGTTINYDVTTDTLSSLATAINNAAIANISATVVTDPSGNPKLQINSSATASPVAVSGDTGDLISHLGLTTTGQAITSANIGGAADGSDNGTVTVKGMNVTATSATGAQGLTLLYNGSAAASGINLGVTVGLGASLYGIVNAATDPISGTVQTEISSLTSANTQNQTKIAQLQAQLALQKTALLAQYTAMETAISSLNNIMSTLTQSFAGLTNAQKNP